MDVINVGSLNIDLVYQVPHFVKPGETLAATRLQEFVGGKGLNQSIALARAGLKVAHVGAVGPDGAMLLDALNDDNVDTQFIAKRQTPSGHAIIQIAPSGENAIVLFPGANQSIELAQLEQALTQYPDVKAVLFQNETNCLHDGMQLAKAHGKTIIYNPAPMLPDIARDVLPLVDIFILNEGEAGMLQFSAADFPRLLCLITHGAEGVVVEHEGRRSHIPATKVEQVVDTTAAGDTFIGYFVAACLQGFDIEEAVRRGANAAALCIQVQGAAVSIPKI